MGGTRAGSVVDGRFECRAEAGSGGMGVVYRALDRESGNEVALKLLVRTGGTEELRFAREAQTLASLAHPGIVRFVAAGACDDGPYLAMEWLDGLDLAQLLEAGPLSLDKSLELGRCVAAALAQAHAAGVVHRDLKPSNLFLRRGRTSDAVILDFGIARYADATRATGTGGLVGTPAYMAPEQARGSSDVDARADVFSLGCVLYECLTGRPPFVGDHAMAVLAKILFEETPRLADAVPVPAAVDAIVARMMAKEPTHRPADGAALAAALAEVQASGTPVPRRAKRGTAPQLLTTGEKRLLGVVLAGRPPAVAETPTLAAAAIPPPQLLYGARLSPLCDGAMIAVLDHAHSPADLARASARCALALAERMPGVPLGVATGLGQTAGQLPVGEVIDRAAALAGTVEPGTIAVDPVTRSFIEADFELTADGQLVGERADAQPVRTLMGQPTRCEGRSRELAMLEAVYAETVDESCCNAVVVTAPAGAGKSRLRYELVRRVSRGSDCQVWITRGDATTAGTPLAMIAQLLQRVFDLRRNEPVATRRAKIVDYLDGVLAQDQRDRAAVFLGEVCNAASDDDSEELAAARRDPLLMADQLERALAGLVEAECRRGPLLLVLEDLHWSDEATVKLVDALLRRAEELPLMVVALARPEVADTFPALWPDHEVQTLELRPLPERAARKLIKRLLPELSRERVAAIVDRAGGNAFYLEELIRAEARGATGALPESVLAMAHARLEALAEEPRRVLRAASILGQTFWRGAVYALVGEATAALETLAADEYISRRPGSEVSDDVEYVFRHDLIREAAYTALTDADRTLGHRLAARWLADHGGDAAVIAEHHVRANESAAAITWYLRAGELAIQAGDFAAAVAFGERALDCGASDVQRADIRLLQAAAARWRGDFAAAQRYGDEAMALLPAGSARWHEAASAVVIGASNSGDAARLQAISRELLTVDLTGGLGAAGHAVPMLASQGYMDLAREVFDKVAKVGAHTFRDQMLLARCQWFVAFVDGDFTRLVDAQRFVVAGLEREGNVRRASMERGNLALSLSTLGRYAEAALIGERACRDAAAMKVWDIHAGACENYAMALIGLGRYAEAREQLEPALRFFGESGNQRMLAYGYMYRALAYMGEGEYAHAVDDLARVPADVPAPVRAYAQALTALCALQRGDTATAVELADTARATVIELGGMPEGGAAVSLAYVRAHLAAGDEAVADAVLCEAYAALQQQAGIIDDPDDRATYLTAVSDHAALVELARQRGIAGAQPS